MLSVPILLIPLAVVCLGVIVFFVYDFISTQYRQWYWKIKHDIQDSVESSIKYRIDSSIKTIVDEVAKETSNPSLVNRFQKLAGISPTYKTDRNSLRDRFNRIRSEASGDYNLRFDLKNMTEDVYIPVREK